MKRKQEYISLARELAESSIVVDALSRLIEQIVSEVYASAAKKKADLKEEIKRVKKESAQWEFAAGQSFVRAEQAEDRAESAERERDEAHYTAHIAETCCARAEERAESAERKVERLRDAAKRLTNSNHGDDSAIEDLEAALKETGPEDGQ